MEFLDFSRSKALNNIPPKKIQDWISFIEESTTDLSERNTKITAINRYADSNIPVEYWNLKMERDFKGDPNLLKKYQEYIQEIKKSYINGVSICLAGNNGVGKTFFSVSILKAASLKGYSCLYINLSDIISVLINSNEDKHLARKELNTIDFLVIDEFDSRFIPSENAADLYARNLEMIFRTRSQNKLPTIMCTNSPNIIESFHGSLKISLDSLMKGYLQIFPVFGEDFRKKKVLNG